MTAAPSNAGSGRGELFRSYLSSRGAIYFAALGSAAVFVYGAYRRDPLIMAAGPVAVIALVLGVVAVLAHKDAEARFYQHYGSALGLVYWPRFALAPLTPLLGAGHRRWCEHWMQGLLPGEPPLPGGIGQLVWEERSERREQTALVSVDGAGARHRLTICAADLEPSIRHFHGVFLRPRRGLVASFPDWLGRTSTRPMELESATFSRRYELLLAHDQDELLARQLFSPSLVAWLSEHPLVPAFELRAGMLVAYVDRRLEDEGGLTYLLDATRRIAARVLDEVAEAASRPAAQSAPSPQPAEPRTS